ncbi:spinster family MFS transporter [Paraburkholderia bannensis]|uniref:spinster family MFS transporter n=1 Tax=Paraburkholderia bannensis TaxID=765414 RepID=UPI002AB0C99D|nr:MFS transporter [Paraburkholderia bannensis]
MDAPQKSSARYVLTLLFLVNTLNFFDRAVPSVAIEALRHEFALNDSALALTAVAFTVLHAVIGIPMGHFADRLKRTRVIAVGVFAWSLFTGLSGAAWNFASFAVARAGVGIGEASCAPAANSMIADLVRPERLGRATGLFMLGYPVGTLSCLLSVGAIAALWGWRMSFLIASLPGVVLAILIFRCAEPKRGTFDTVTTVHRRLDATTAWSILRISTVLWLCLFASFVTAASYSMTSFLPALLMRCHGLSVIHASQLSAVILGATGLFGLTLGGWLADRVQRVWNRGRLVLGCISMFIAAPLLWLGMSTNGGSIMYLAILLSSGWFLYYFYFVTVYPTLMEVVPPDQRGIAIATLYFFANVLGGGIGSYATGALSDHFAIQAMTASGATTMADAFRATGLNSAMQAIVPGAIGFAGAALIGAIWTFKQDRMRGNEEAPLLHRETEHAASLPR